MKRARIRRTGTIAALPTAPKAAATRSTRPRSRQRVAAGRWPDSTLLARVPWGPAFCDRIPGREFHLSAISVPPSR